MDTGNLSGPQFMWLWSINVVLQGPTAFSWYSPSVLYERTVYKSGSMQRYRLYDKLHSNLSTHGCPTMLWQRTAAAIVGWFTGHMKKNNKWYTSPPKLLCDFYRTYIIYKCDHRPHNTTWKAVGWRPTYLTKHLWLTFDRSYTTRTNEMHNFIN